MVLLTMTASIVEALEKIQALGANLPEEGHIGPAESQASEKLPVSAQSTEKEGEGSDSSEAEGSKVLKDERQSAEPKLSNPKVGNPISHGQIIDISTQMKSHNSQPCRLEELLKGSKVYIPPPPPKPEPTSEYKALMARLRREEEARSYERMTNPPPPMETFSQRFPASSAAHAFPASFQNVNTSDPDDDGTTYADIDRQMALIFNVLISIVACAAAIWIAARWWSTPMRLALSMSGSMLVGVAEVVVYSGYIRRVSEAKGKEKSIKEVKEVVNTWVVGGDEVEVPIDKSVPPAAGDIEVEDVKARRRKKDIS